MLQITQLKALEDNYVYLIREPNAEMVGVVDPSVFGVVEEELKKEWKRLDCVFNTHHHFDHVGGNQLLKARYKCRIFGSIYDRHRIPDLDDTVEEKRTPYLFGKEPYQVFEIPGHTLGHIAYYFPRSEALFCGDTLFSAGCGRLFEGTPEQMRESLKTLASLPPYTKVYCGHEYTLNNLKFAASLLPDNSDIESRLEKVVERRTTGRPTVPSLMEEELRTNVFLPPLLSELRAAVKLPKETTDVEVFAEVRRRKDHFRP